LWPASTTQAPVAVASLVRPPFHAMMVAIRNMLEHSTEFGIAGGQG
jgi:hypothetical protein